MSNQKNIDDIHKLQKNCVRCIYRAKKNAHTDPLFKRLKILKFPDMIKLELQKLGHKVCHKKLPKLILKLFSCKEGSKTHLYPTWNKNTPNIQSHNGNIMNKSFLCRSISWYQQLSYKLKRIENQSTFVREAKKNLLL